MAVDNIARALAASGIRIAASHTFANETARDDYFTANPADLVGGIYIVVDSQLEQWDGARWVDKTPVIKGPKGATGPMGESGPAGEPGPRGEPGPTGGYHSAEHETGGTDEINLAGLAGEPSTLTTHKADIASEQGRHGIRYFNETLEVYVDEEWVELQTGGGSEIPVGNVESFSADPDDAQVSLTWVDPDDAVIEGITFATWAGTKILRKIGSYPTDQNDGTEVVNNSVRDQYSSTPYIDTGLTNDTEYFYMAFPYTTNGVYNVNEANRVSATPIEPGIYGVRVDKENSNPETRVTYIGNAVGFSPMRGNNGNLDWGSWQNSDLIEGIKPCVLENLGSGNAQVNYYLNPDDFTQKENGSSAVLNGNDGDVMIEIPERWWKFTDEGTTYTVEVSDKPFDGAIKMAHEIEDGYNQASFYPLTLLQCIMIILLKSTDTQTALGRGRVGGAGHISTGNTDSKGMFYGSEADEQMKFLGLEDFWGNNRWWIDGCFYDNRNIYIGTENFNDTGNGYDDKGSYGNGDLGGYIDSVQAGNHTGFTPKGDNGSGSTYYSDYGDIRDGRMPYVGGSRTHADAAGGFYLYSNTAASSLLSIGARLCFKKGDKLYMGVYLGTVTGDKLRSLSGTSEPTGGKTIGAFRTDAKANNN